MGKNVAKPKSIGFSPLSKGLENPEIKLIVAYQTAICHVVSQSSFT